MYESSRFYLIRELGPALQLDLWLAVPLFAKLEVDFARLERLSHGFYVASGFLV